MNVSDCISALPSYANPRDAQVLARFVVDAIAAGFVVSVNDGEEWTVIASTDARAILAACMSTDADTLRVRRADRSHVGDVFFVWGNNGECLTDHTDNAATHDLVRGAESVAEGFA